MSISTVHPYEKKAFIYWFLNQYKMKRRESNWLLTFIASNNEVLRNTHFVRDANVFDRSIRIATTCSNEAPFLFHRNQIWTEEPEKAFHDIRLNREETLYIELHFDNWRQCPQYALVLEDFVHRITSTEVTKEDSEQADNVLNYSLQQRRKELLLKEIDDALDRRDVQAFTRLSSELKRLEQTLSN